MQNKATKNKTKAEAIIDFGEMIEKQIFPKQK